MTTKFPLNIVGCELYKYTVLILKELFRAFCNQIIFCQEADIHILQCGDSFQRVDLLKGMVILSMCLTWARTPNRPFYLWACADIARESNFRHERICFELTQSMWHGWIWQGRAHLKCSDHSNIYRYISLYIHTHIYIYLYTDTYI